MVTSSASPLFHLARPPPVDRFDQLLWITLPLFFFDHTQDSVTWPHLKCVTPSLSEFDAQPDILSPVSHKDALQLLHLCTRPLPWHRLSATKSPSHKCFSFLLVVITFPRAQNRRARSLGLDIGQVFDFATTGPIHVPNKHHNIKTSPQKLRRSVIKCKVLSPSLP